VKTIYGQTRAIDALIRARDEGRRHHAWVFSGPSGVGKCTAAIWFAKQLLGIGDSENSSHPDLHIVRKEDVVWSINPSLQRRKQTNIPLDLLRERIIGGKTSDGKNHDAVAYKTPILGKEKVFIIDEAELLDEAGQNALLKTLEEPPVGTTIILVTCREDLLLPTILSRCQILPFSPLGADEMREWVEKYSGDATPADLSWAMRFSGGSPGLVCEAVESGLPELAKSIGDFLSLEKLDSYTEATDCLISFIDKSVARWIKENPNTSKDAANRRAARLVLLLFSLSARALIRKNHPDGVRLAGVLVDIEKQLSTNISMRVLLESLCARWSSVLAGVSTGDALFI
jgi:DNA polymerase-3 subunit delta'